MELKGIGVGGVVFILLLVLDCFVDVGIFVKIQQVLKRIMKYKENLVNNLNIICRLKV